MEDEKEKLLRQIFSPVTLVYAPSDDEIVVASDLLAAKGELTSLLPGVTKPFSGRGHPGAVRWRKARRQARHRQKPERKAKNRANEAAYKARKKEADPEGVRAVWKIEGERRSAKRKESNAVAYLIGVDAEGGYTGRTCKDEEGNIYREQRTNLWGVGNDDKMLRLEAPPGEFLSSVQILDFLCDARCEFPKEAKFIGCGLSYDATQAFKDVLFKVAWRIQHKKAVHRTELSARSPATIKN